ncbi:MAG TPA: GTP-binding protein, partial [Candidatus Polarisedimenticolia bacterium]|nr:GTP-binding protein [Candidatus Polarisedimenticolia bacterium]
MTLPSVAIVGAPNSGKSSLFNRLLGRRKALVHSEAGMTRDVNEASCDLEGTQVTLLDTGGLLAGHPLPMAPDILRRVVEVARKADVLIFVVDGRAGLSLVEEELARLFHGTGRPVVVAVNKLDVPGRDQASLEFHRLGFPSIVPISAEHGLGTYELIEAVKSLLPPP